MEQKYGLDSECSFHNEKGAKYLMFDGCKDNTIVSGPSVLKFIKEEHVIVEQPGNKYRANVTP